MKPKRKPLPRKLRKPNVIKDYWFMASIDLSDSYARLTADDSYWISPPQARRLAAWLIRFADWSEARKP